MYKKCILISSLFTLICSCSNNLQVDNFSSSKINTFQLKQDLRQKFAVASFSSKDKEFNEIPCRGLGIPGGLKLSLPNNESYVKYIENAFTETLIDAEKYDSNNSKHLQGKITGIDFNSVSGNWNISGVFSLNKKNVVIDKKYPYPTAIEAQLACYNTAKSFKDVVSNFVMDVLKEVV